MVTWKDVITGQWMGPDPVVSWVRGAVCVFPQDPGREPVWVPERLTRTANIPKTHQDQTTKEDGYSTAADGDCLAPARHLVISDPPESE